MNGTDYVADLRRIADLDLYSLLLDNESYDALVATGGTKALSATLKKVGAFEIWARRATGIVFLAVGIYLSVRFVFLG